MKFTIHRSESSGQYWARLTARNGDILAHTEQYVAKASALHAAQVIQAEAESAPIEDLT